ncbi:substrate-binding domain-containing protein [Streptomyces sulphureus]|uniref:substrate-binding and VWA domain-containing protein n=1 Tax=Streptomyces sulphureus TaxID=47758 RepID=UPI000477F7D9
MARHSLPDDQDTSGSGYAPTAAPPSRKSARRRNVMLATALVVALGAGTGVAAQKGMLPFGSGCDGETVELRVAASPDIAPVLRRVAERTEDGEAKSDGRCMDVRVSARAGAEMADALQHGGSSGKAPEYEVWLPDSSFWIEQATASGNASAADSLGSVASSPITLAAVPPAAKALGWPKKQYSWGQIADSSAPGDELRIGTADPARSATGLLALTRIQESAAKAGGKDAETKTAAAAKQLAERTAPGDSQVLATLPRDDSGTELGNPKRNQALVLSEQAAHSHNKGSGDSPDLQLFYPKDGLTLLDYPYALVDSDDLSTEQSRAAMRFQTLLGDTQGQRALTTGGFRPKNGDAVEDISTAAGAKKPQPYAASPAGAPSPKSVQETLGMWTITVQSARFTLVVDASASMAAEVPGRPGESRMDVTKASLMQGLSQFTPEDEVGLWEFATRLDGKHDYRELVPTVRLGDRAGSGATQREKLLSAFGKMHPIPGGATGLYDTTLAAYKKAAESYSSGKFNAVVLLTDGANEDPGSISRKELLTELDDLADDKRPVPLIAIAVGPDADEDAAKEIAKATSGSAHQVNDPAQIHEVILKAIMAAGSGA